VSSVTDMYAMFVSAKAFNQDLSGWDVDQVTNCAYFFLATAAWNEPKPNFTNCNPID